jgi:hypothetical protein
MWRVVIWTTANNGDSFDVDTKDDAYTMANEHSDAYAVEIYGPDGFYDGVQ